MAITIYKEPTSPNLANGYLVYRVGSNQNSQSQFQYVVDIKDNSNNLIQRIKQQPNPNGFGIFDISRIITTELTDTDEVWKTPVTQTQTNCAGQFKIYFGEEYGTSVSSSVTLYTGNGPAGSPAKTGSAYYYNLDGVSNPNDLVAWNWDSGSKLDYVNPAAIKSTASFDNALTDFTSNTVRSTDYHTISLLNGNMTGGADSATSAQDVYIMRVQEYDTTDTLLNTMYWYNADYASGNGGPRTSPSQLWADAYTSQSANTKIIHFPAGPQNFLDDGNPLEPATSYYILDFFDQNPGGSLGNVRWASIRMNIEENCDYEGTRFAWKNTYGVWDYYNFTLVKTANTDVERSSFKQSFLNYAASNVNYSKQRRGETQYYNKLTEKHTAESDWLTQTDADNLRELFYSANVYIQDSTEFLPVVITNSTVTQKKNVVGQKLFKYTVEYQYANDLIARR